MQGLRQDIEQHVTKWQRDDPLKAARVINVLLSEDLRDVKECSDQLFPHPSPSLEAIAPWVVLGSDISENEVALQRACKKSFDSNLLQHLILEGCQVIGDSSLIVAVGDLCDKEAMARCRSAIEVLRGCLSGLVEPGTPVIAIGVFTLRRFVASSDSPTGRIRDAEPEFDVESLAEVDMDATLNLLRDGELFDRVFLVDVATQEGVLLTGPADQHLLLSQIINAIVAMQARTIDPDEFIRWARNSGVVDGCISSAGVFMLDIPVADIVEKVAVAKGCDVLESAVLKCPNLSHSTFYFNDFLVRNRTSSTDTLQAKIAESISTNFVEPFAKLPNFNEMTFASQVTEIIHNHNSSIESAAQLKVLLLLAGREELAVLKNSLFDYADSIIRGEFGGLTLAREFLKQLEENLKLEHEKSKSAELTERSDSAIKELSCLVTEEAFAESLAIRLAVLLITIIAAVSVFSASPASFAITLASVLLTGSAVGGFLWHSSKTRRENKLNDTISKLRKNWSLLKRNAVSEVTSSLQLNLLEAVTALRVNLEGASSRIEFVIEHFSKSGMDLTAADHPTRRCLVDQADPFKSYIERANVDIGPLAMRFLREDTPSQLWRHFVAQSATLPSGRENLLFERAALRVVPTCQWIAELVLYDEMPKDAGMRERLFELILNGTTFYLRIDPNLQRRSTSFRGHLESATHALGDQLLSSLIKRTGGTFGSNHQGAVSRVTSIVFLDGVELAAVKWR